MKERLLQLINHLNYTATRFADEIGVQRSGISHILSGRNQPSYDFLTKTIKKFPEISVEWLLTGEGNIIKSNNEQDYRKREQLLHKALPDEQPDLFNVKKLMKSVNPDEKVDASGIVTNVNKITSVIVLFSDGTFTDYHPSRQE